MKEDTRCLMHKSLVFQHLGEEKRREHGIQDEWAILSHTHIQLDMIQQTGRRGRKEKCGTEQDK